MTSPTIRSFFIIAMISVAGLITKSVAQGQENHWYFGFSAGLDFSSGIPMSASGSTMTTDEGVASISDASGNLLFYTNGSEVYNRLHQQMPGGFGLSGHFSSSQSALIVPSDIDSMHYYIFTVPAQTIGNFCYSIVDMSLNGGLGDIIQKNTFLQSDVCEKLTAVRHADKKTVWVVVHGWNSNSFHAYPVNCNGVGSAVVSSAGSLIEPNDPVFLNESIGCMRLSPDGKRIAYTWSSYIRQTNEFKTWVEIAEFNNATGVVSNAVTIEHSGTTIVAQGYGLEFSASSRYLYWSESGLNNGIAYSKLYQYDVLAPNIQATESVVGTTFQAMGTLQRGPDDKIYIARLNGATYVSVVHFPDLQGTACTFDEPGVSIAPGISTWGLPNNWDTHVEEEQEIFTFDDTLLCSAPLILTASYPYPEFVAGYLWNTGSQDSVIAVSESGIYKVQVLLTCDTITDSVNVLINDIDFSLGSDTVLCYPQTMMLAGPEAAGYLWNTGDVTREVTVADTGIYILTIFDSLGCQGSDTLNVTADGCGCGLYIPSAVTMNNDGINDHFLIYSSCRFTDFSLLLFNRWGQLIFKTVDPQFTWNCELNDKPIDQNVYAYYLEYKTPDISDDILQKRGTVTFIR